MMRKVHMSRNEPGLFLRIKQAFAQMRLSCFVLSVTMAHEPSVADNFGLNFTECASDYFRPGAEWPLQDCVVMK